MRYNTILITDMFTVDSYSALRKIICCGILDETSDSLKDSVAASVDEKNNKLQLEGPKSDIDRYLTDIYRRLTVRYYWKRTVTVCAVTRVFDACFWVYLVAQIQCGEQLQYPNNGRFLVDF